MATIEQVYTAINKEVLDDVSLGATSTSKMAEWRKILYTVTSISEILQGLWDVKKRELKRAAELVPTCNSIWWANEIKKFQYGHQLQINSNYEYFYLVDDEAAKIIKHAAIYSRPGKGLIKVAKEGPTRLTTSELQSVRAFKNKILPLGSNIVVSSHDPDEIKILGNVYYDPLVPLTQLQPKVEQAILDYLSSLEFQEGSNGAFYMVRLTDEIQKVTGVTDFVPEEISIRQNGNEDSLVPITRKHISFAGYMTIHPDHPLNGSINYIPES